MYIRMLQNDPNIKGEYFDKFGKRWLVQLTNNKRTTRARYIMAKFLCCPDFHIPKILLVHHISGDTLQDDLPTNLQLTSFLSHRRLHPRREAKSPYGISQSSNPCEYSRRWYRANQERAKEVRKSYRETHREYAQQYAKRYRLTHKEQITQKCHEWYISHRNIIIQKTREYYQTHKEEKREYDLNYRQEKKQFKTREL